MLRLGGGHPHEILGALVFGVAVVGAAFLLAWGAEALELDVSRGLALAVLALIAVLPEYAVDFTFAWKAGTDPDTYAPLALANMTGGNRLLIGIGWPLVVFLAAWRIRSIARRAGLRGRRRGPTEVHLDRPHAIEIGFLAHRDPVLARRSRSRTTSRSSTRPSWSSSTWPTCSASRALRPRSPSSSGRRELLGALPTVRRRVLVGIMLGYAAFAILMSAEPFAESLVETGSSSAISTFLLVQWLAPLASEAPELLVAGLFAWRLKHERRARDARLVEGQPVDAARRIAAPRVRDRRRRAQRPAARRAPARGAVPHRGAVGVRGRGARQPQHQRPRSLRAPRVSSSSQFVLGAVLPPELREWERIAVGIVYLVLAVVMVIRQRRSFRPLVRDAFRTPVDQMVGS